MNAAAREPLLIACLCAGWCTTCQSYTATFADVARAHPDSRFVWIDIEEHSDTLGDAALDIENFPTVMLQRGAEPLFLGTVLPHGTTLARMIAAAQAGALARTPVDAELAAAVRQLATELPAAHQG